MSKAWRKTIEEQYRSQLINSERGLQIYFCSALINEFRASGVERTVFVEPRVKLDSLSRYPDLLICDDREIIGIIEIKYLPRERPKYLKDIKTLESIATHSTGLSIENERFCGVPIGKRPFQLASDAVLCWAGVYTGNRLKLCDELDERVHDRFLQLDAITARGKHPTVLIAGREQS